MNNNQKSVVRSRDKTAKGGDEWLNKMILISPNELPLVARSRQQQVIVDNPSRKQTNQKQDEESFRDHACLQLTLSAIPKRLALFCVHEEDLFDLQISFCREYKKRIDEEKQANNGTSTDTYKQVMDRVCEEFAVRADQVLFQNRNGTVLRKCPLYRKPTRVYDHQLSQYREQFKSNEQIRK
jgi:hypothetical protein